MAAPEVISFGCGSFVHFTIWLFHEAEVLSLVTAPAVPASCFLRTGLRRCSKATRATSHSRAISISFDALRLVSTYRLMSDVNTNEVPADGTPAPVGAPAATGRWAAGPPTIAPAAAPPPAPATPANAGGLARAKAANTTPGGSKKVVGATGDGGVASIDLAMLKSVIDDSVRAAHGRSLRVARSQ